MTLVARLVYLPLVAAMAAAAPAVAQTPPPNLGQLSIEDLMKIEVTTASRKQQRAADVPSAVFVLTHDDIRRSGMTTIPDLLRLVPGVDVAQINSNKWAVSVRGFNGLYGGELLVLVDGRSIYNRLYSGVLWDAEDLLLDDIDRIEVIRGPGAAVLWGANAVNGVINIVSKPAADTVGGLVRVDIGGAGAQAAARYGGAFGAMRYRLFTQWTGRDQSLIAAGIGADDGSHSVTAGGRADWTTRPGAVTVQGALTAGRTRALWSNLDPSTADHTPIADEPSNALGGYLVGRFTHTRASGASLQLQSFVDITGRQEPIADYTHQAVDVDAQYHTTLGGSHDLVAGAGYRFIGEKLVGRGGFSLVPAADHSSLLTAFIQDEIALFDDRLAVTLGSQVQYDSAEGAGVQPTVRAIWKGLARQRFWAATSRALRTPSLTDRGIRVDYPPVPTASGLPLLVTVMGNPDAETVTFVDAEAGYRLEIGPAASIDITAFAGRYDRLRTLEPGAPVVDFVPSPQIKVTSQFSSLLQASTRGVEVAGQWNPIPAWRLDGSYTALRVIPRLAPESRDPLAASEDGNAPRAQWQVHSAYAPGTRATLNVALLHVGPLERFQVAGYTRADINAEWRFTSGLSASIIGQNLFDAAHAEFAAAGTLLSATRVPRSVGVRLRWTFR